MAKKTKSKKTLVTFLLDRSGSMESIKDDTIGAFNAYLGGLKSGKEDIEFTFVQFDSMSIDKLFVREPVSKVPDLNGTTFQPRGGTPLIDAAYKTIKAVEESLKGDAKTQVVVCIQTDGHENASTEHTWDELQALIKEKTKLGWQFNFMGASIDAYAQGSRMGISASNTMSYDSTDRAKTFSAFSTRASATTLYASGARPDMTFTSLEKQAAGDKFDPALKGVKSPVATAQQFKKKIVDDLKL